MNVGSLFSGIGGIELGLEHAGFETSWFVENDKHAQAVLRKNFPNAVIYDDITQLDFSTVQKVDVLTGGFPCQDISIAGKRAGITGSRSSLWKYYLEAIRVLRPKYVIAENVSALISYGLNVVLADLASVGYDAEWHCVPASAVGAPHRRDRIFIIAYPNEEWMRKLESLRSSEQLAYSDSCGCVHGQAQEQPNQGRQHAFGDSREGCTDVANTSCIGCGQDGNREFIENDSMADANVERLEKQELQQGLHARQREIRVPRKIMGSRTSQGWWSVEPDVGRVADGVPSRVDRIKRLGNAVVPQVAQAIGETMKQTHNHSYANGGSQ